MSVARADPKLIARVFDWAKIASKLPEGSTARKDLSALRSKHEQLRERLDKVPEKGAPIDFAHYRKLIADPAFVDGLEKTYKDLLEKVPYPEDTFTPEIEAREKEAEKHFLGVIEESKDIAKEFQTSLDEFLTLPPFEGMTQNEFYDRFPKYEKKIGKMLDDMEYIEGFKRLDDLFSGTAEKAAPKAK